MYLFTRTLAAKLCRRSPGRFTTVDTVASSPATWPTILNGNRYCSDLFPLTSSGKPSSGIASFDNDCILPDRTQRRPSDEVHVQTDFYYERDRVCIFVYGPSPDSDDQMTKDAPCAPSSKNWGTESLQLTTARDSVSKLGSSQRFSSNRPEQRRAPSPVECESPNEVQCTIYPSQACRSADRLRYSDTPAIG